MKTEEIIRRDLSHVAASGTPKMRRFAAWLLDNLPSVAFASIRRLAHDAEVNPNSVIRMAHELGYDGYDAFRADIQRAMKKAPASYEGRALALRDRPDADLYAELSEASHHNAEIIFSDEGLDLLESCVEPILGARRVYSVGVRSCFSVAHYFSYVGGMAFGNFAPVPTLPGSTIDQVSQCGPEDIVLAVTYEHYSAEVLHACQIARDCGARVIALTDSYSSPIALDAWKVLRLPMAGPQLMPSLTAAFIAVEVLLAAMAARSATAAENVARSEARINRFGGYQRRILS